MCRRKRLQKSRGAFQLLSPLLLSQLMSPAFILESRSMTVQYLLRSTGLLRAQWMPRLTRHYPYSRPVSLPFGSTFVFGSVVQIFLPSEAVGDDGWRLPLRTSASATVQWLLRLAIRLVGLLSHPELQFQQVGLGTAGGFGLLPIAIVEGLTAVIERVDDVLALVLLKRVLLQAVFLQVSLGYGYTLLPQRREKTDPELRTGGKVRAG